MIFDIEANGLYWEASKIHVIAMAPDADSQVKVFSNGPKADGSLLDGLRLLAEADELVGHNIIDYDIPVIQKIYPWWKPKGKIRDTLVYSSLLYPDMLEKDYAKAKARHGQWIPPQCFGRHSLEAWGYRLGHWKGDFNGPWEAWTQEMEDYCRQDVVVTQELLRFFLAKEPSEDAVQLEHYVAWIISRQSRRGFKFNKEKAEKLTAEMSARREELAIQLRDYFPARYVAEGSAPFIPKRDNSTVGYVKNAPLCKVQLQHFNPASRQQIADRLISEYGWRPTEYTEPTDKYPQGQPEVSEDTLASTSFTCSPLLIEYLMIDKRIGYVAEGKKALLKTVGPDGAIHGRVKSIGAVTRRMTHSDPNVAQCPAVDKPYGEQTRELFEARDGYVLVGCDADGLELRMLGAYMAQLDGGEYATAVVQGKKEDGTDCHSVTKKALEFNDRNNAKTWIYAFLYGCGPEKSGSIVLDDMGPEAKKIYTHPDAIKKLGQEAMDKIGVNMPALTSLVESVKSKVKQQGFLWSLDGVPLQCRAEHSALNTLLQSAGAIVMKRAAMILDMDLRAAGLKYGTDYEFVANIHDEFQIEVRPEHAELVGQTAAQAITKAGEYYKLPIPLSGSYAIGKNWKETH